jgi:hypothetical protein
MAAKGQHDRQRDSGARVDIRQTVASSDASSSMLSSIGLIALSGRVDSVIGLRPPLDDTGLTEVVSRDCA